MTTEEAIYKMLLQVLKNQVAGLAWLGMDEQNRRGDALMMLILETEALVANVTEK